MFSSVLVKSAEFQMNINNNKDILNCLEMNKHIFCHSNRI